MRQHREQLVYVLVVRFVPLDLVKKVLVVYADEVIARDGVDAVGGVKAFNLIVEFQVDNAFGEDGVFEIRCGEVDDLVVQHDAAFLGRERYGLYVYTCICVYVLYKR